MKDPVSIGDPVEVRVMKRVNGGHNFTEWWLPATVVYVTLRSIGVAFFDGERLAVVNGGWRRA